MAEKRIITQICVVVKDVRTVSSNWAGVLGMPEEKIETIFPEGIYHYTHGEAANYKDCQVVKYNLDGFVLELIQPGESASPWKTFLEKNGQGVFHYCLFVDDRKVFQQELSRMGVAFPYHIGYHPQGSYSYVDSKEQLGLELSVNDQKNYSDLIMELLDGKVIPLEELK